jgi:hypothetical protein
VGKYLDILKRDERDKSDKSDKSAPKGEAGATFGRFCRFGRSAEPIGSEGTWTDGEEERAAIAEYDGGAPRAWAEALARLDANKPPGDVPPRRWLRFVDDCGRFLDGGWAARAAAFGWGPLDLFGCDRERPFARVDHLGLLWLLNGGCVVELHRDRAILETERGARQCYRRRPVEVGRVVLAWELSHGGGSTPPPSAREPSPSGTAHLGS